MPGTEVPIELPSEDELRKLASSVQVPGPIFMRDLHLDEEAFDNALALLREELFGDGNDEATGLANSIAHWLSKAGPVFATNVEFINELYMVVHEIAWEIAKRGDDVSIRISYEITRHFIPQFLLALNQHLFDQKREQLATRQLPEDDTRKELKKIQRQQHTKAEALTERWKRRNGGLLRH